MAAVLGVDIVSKKTDKSPIDLKLDPNLEQSAKRKGKKRGRKPSIKKLINNENTSDSISKINDNFLSESGELESEIDQVTLANMIKIEKKFYLRVHRAYF